MNKKIMEYAKTAHNRTVYASPPLAARATAGTLCVIWLKIFCKIVYKKLVGKTIEL
jgi:hypothetical protein